VPGAAPQCHLVKKLIAPSFRAGSKIDNRKYGFSRKNHLAKAITKIKNSFSPSAS
jgi:hypothetical protein